ncbi:hypothetical protein F4823DRAFT_576050 [Ustulina deusta]|nr:hypothetical protein F4823DRAFT_576050 [Ustulina deusta]
MGLLASTKNDIRLGNLTIYGQWLGVLSGIALGILYVWGFFEAPQYPTRWAHFGGLMNTIVTIARFINGIVLPLGPCFLEIPHLHMRFPWIVTLQYCWLSIALFICFFLAFPGRDFTITSFLQIAFILITKGMSMAQSAALLFKRDIMQRWDRLGRVGFYIFFTVISATPLGFPFIDDPIWRPLRWSRFLFGLPSIPSIFSISAAVLYCVAIFMEHGFVFSQVLGGSGVEPMDFTIPGFGPELNSIDGEGSIRL